MARKTSRPPQVLDDEVAYLVTRIGATKHPKNFMREYNVARTTEGQTWVTVVFLADDEFCRLPEIEVPGQEEISIEDGGKE